MAEDVVVVVRPSTGLTPDAIRFDKRHKPPRELTVPDLHKGKVQVVVGKSAKEAPGGRAFILELEDPKTVSVPKVMIGQDPNFKGGVKQAAVRYKELIIVEPYSLWHRAAAGADPVLLGRAFLSGSASPLQTSGSGNTITYTLTKETPAQLTEKFLRTGVFDIPGQMSLVVADNLVAAKGKQSITSEGVLALARQLPPVFTPPRLVNGTITFDPRSKPLPTGPSVTFLPSRVVKADDGSLDVEVDMWNRLPVRALGMLRRTPSKAESAVEEQLRKKRLAVAGAPITKSRGARFDLAPGEKFAAKFHIPKEVSVNPAFFRTNEITVDLSALGELVAEKVGKAPKKAKKK